MNIWNPDSHNLKSRVVWDLSVGICDAKQLNNSSQGVEVTDELR